MIRTGKTNPEDFFKNEIIGKYGLKHDIALNPMFFWEIKDDLKDLNFQTEDFKIESTTEITSTEVIDGIPKLRIVISPDEAVIKMYSVAINNEKKRATRVVREKKITADSSGKLTVDFVHLIFQHGEETTDKRVIVTRKQYDKDGIASFCRKLTKQYGKSDFEDANNYDKLSVIVQEHFKLATLNLLDVKDIVSSGSLEIQRHSELDEYAHYQRKIMDEENLHNIIVPLYSEMFDCGVLVGMDMNIIEQYADSTSATLTPLSMEDAMKYIDDELAPQQAKDTIKTRFDTRTIDRHKMI